jgi:hypothetical protein
MSGIGNLECVNNPWPSPTRSGHSFDETAMSSQLAADLARRYGDALPKFVDTKAAAEILSVSGSFLNKARLTGDGPPYAKFGFHVRYSVPSLLAWAESRTRTSTSEEAA